MKEIAGLVGALQKAEHVLVLSHLFPDGDCIGSSIALALGLQAMGKEVEVANADPVPEMYLFLEGSELVKQPSQLSGKVSTVVLVDCTDPERVGAELATLLAPGVCLLNIDHHVSNSGFGQHRLVEEVAATGELVYKLLLALGVRVTPAMATALYTAIVTDTGSFQYENTKSSTLRLAADLLDSGCNQGGIRDNLWERMPLKSILLLKEALQSLSFAGKGKIAYLTVPGERYRALGVTDEHWEGLINYPRSIEGVEVAFLFRELENGVVKVGMRSKSYLDVNKLAARFGGGGHHRAAGCLVEGPFPQVVAEVVAAAQEILEG